MENEKPGVLIQFEAENDIRFATHILGRVSPLQLYTVFSLLADHFKQITTKQIFASQVQQEPEEKPDLQLPNESKPDILIPQIGLKRPIR